MASSKAPTPGRTTRSGAVDRGRIAGDRRFVPDLLEAFLHATQIAHAVVDYRDHAVVSSLRNSGNSGREVERAPPAG